MELTAACGDALGLAALTMLATVACGVLLGLAVTCALTWFFDL